MNSGLKEVYSARISILQSFDFEDFIKELFLIRYGTSGFTPTRPKKDKGCDGIIVDTKTIVACYGPVTYDEKAYSKKAKEDYADFQRHWKNNYPNWQFVFNNRLGPNAISIIDKLHKGSIPWGLDHIMSIISNELNSTQRRKVADALGIPKKHISQDYLEEVLENLLSKTITDPNTIYQFNSVNLIDVQEKIKINYTEDDVQIAIDEFENLLPTILETDRIFKAFEDEEQDKIKSRVINDYKNASGSFKERLQIITQNYLRQYSSATDDDYRYNATAVLLYLFEQCLIGKKI
ncbi:MAG: hypothetical protein HYZ44_10225 [Bacteroidetes bacterium]|nr:hypothetical protein [Bacteroidota bacterium]